MNQGLTEGRSHATATVSLSLASIASSRSRNTTPQTVNLRIAGVKREASRIEAESTHDPFSTTRRREGGEGKG